MLSFLIETTNNKAGMVLKCTIICLGLTGGCPLPQDQGISIIEDNGSGFEESGSGFEESGSELEDGGS